MTRCFCTRPSTSHFTLLLYTCMLLSLVNTSKTFDSHGCDVSAGEFYCKKTKSCAFDHSACNRGVAHVQNDCTYVFDGAKLPFKYNLSSLILPSSYYQIADKTVAASGNHLSLLFNFCKKIRAPSTLPEVCHSSTVGSGG